MVQAPKESRFKLRFVSVIFLFLIVVFGMSIFRNVLRIRRVNEEIARKEADVEKLKVKNEELQKRIQELGSEVYIEGQIRNNLGLVKEGEIVVVLPNPDILRKLTPVYEKEEEEQPKHNWEKWMDLFL